MPFAFTCDGCGAGFTRHQRHPARFCSIACKAASQRYLPDAEPRPCPHCGTVFTPIRKEASFRKFCSHGCAAAFHGTAHLVTPEVVARGANARRGRGTKHPYVKLNHRHRHRVVAEQMLGRPLEKGEVVARRRLGDRSDTPENLIVFPTRADFGRAIMKAIHSKEKELQPCAC